MNRFKIVDISPEQVKVDQIDDATGPYCMSYGFDTTLLTDAISRIGLINTPILIRKGEGGRKIQFLVVTGLKRIKALRKLGEPCIPCRILPSETPSLECLLMNLYENLTSRGFNPVEKGMALARLLKWVPEKEVLKTYMPLFDLPSHEETLHLFVQIEKDLEPPVKDLIAGEFLSIKAAGLLLEMDSAAREKFCRYFSAIALSKNQQTQFIDFIKDLSSIEGLSIARLLELPELTNIRDNAQMNSPQKARALIKFLRARRLPRLVRAEKGFSRMVNKLALPAGCGITPPPFFEGPHYRFEILFKNGEDLRGKLLALAEKEGLVTFEDPWNKIV